MPYRLVKGPRDANRNKKGKKRRRLVEENGFDINKKCEN